MGTFIRDNPEKFKSIFSHFYKNGFLYRVITEHEVLFAKDNLTIFLSEEKYDDGVQMSISFDADITRKDLFNIGWIYRVDKNQNPFIGKTSEEQLKILADYYSENSDRINDPSFCKKMREKYNLAILNVI